MEHHDKKLTAVVAAMDTFAEIREILAWLHGQTVRRQLQILIVCESAGGLAMLAGLVLDDGPAHLCRREQIARML